MKLLIVTQVIDKNHPILGFFHRWVEEFAKHCEQVHVICLYEGVHSLPENVSVHSLGKENGKNKLKYLFNFYTYILSLRKEYDNVFVHMNQIYVILGVPLWRLMRKKVGLWYAHGTVSTSLKIAEKMTDLIITSTPEGFRLPSKKVHIVGQGIDTNHFSYQRNSYDPNFIRILYVGRISPIKQCEVLVEAVALLRDKGIRCHATFVGDIEDPETKSYYNSLREKCFLLKIEDMVTFTGGIPNTEVVKYLRQADVFANTSMTGSLDKTGLEAIACGVPVVTANEAYSVIFKEYSQLLMHRKGDPKDLAKCIAGIHNAENRFAVIDRLTEWININFSVNTFVSKLIARY